MFEMYNNTLCVQANWLDEMGVVSLDSLKKLFQRGKIKKARSGRGLGNYALYIYESLPQRFRDTIEHDLNINPYEAQETIYLTKYLKPNPTVTAFFANYELEDGRYLSEVNQNAADEYTANINVLLAIKTAYTIFIETNKKINKGLLWKRLTNAIHNFTPVVKSNYPHKLPTNPRALRAKYEACILEKPNKRYNRKGYEGIIHDNYCNNNSTKITDAIGDWLMAMYSLPVKHSIYILWKAYNEARCDYGWPVLSESAITNYLMKPERERIWTLARDGREAYDKKYGHTLSRDKTKLFPDAYWAIDGTKLDCVHYWDNSAKMAATCKINVVIDVYSEKILGYSFSFTENHVDHFIATKMAVNTAGTKPYNFTYDAQAAHRSKRMQELYDKLIAKGGTHYHHKVGRKSNPIEQVFNRMQQQVFNKRWFSDGQGIKSKQSRSQANMDFLHDNKEALPTIDELQHHFELMVEEWNNSPRSKTTTKTRNEYYQQKNKHYHNPLPIHEQIAMFWIDETKPKKYYAHGMPLTVAGNDYLYEVYNSKNEVDADFRRKYVQQKLIVSYDPEYLDDYVALYRINENNNKVFVAYAQTKRKHTPIPTLMQAGDRELLNQDLAVRALEQAHDWEAYKKIAERTGITREALIEDQNAAINESDFNAKRMAYATKAENLKTDRNSMFNRAT